MSEQPTSRSKKEKIIGTSCSGVTCVLACYKCRLLRRVIKTELQLLQEFSESRKFVFRSWSFHSLFTGVDHTFVLLLYKSHKGWVWHRARLTVTALDGGYDMCQWHITHHWLKASLSRLAEDTLHGLTCVSYATHSNLSSRERSTLIALEKQYQIRLERSPTCCVIGKWFLLLYLSYPSKHWLRFLWCFSSHV